jgi:hypothetical protein
VDNEPHSLIKALISGRLYPFSGGLHDDLPLARPGAYTIWKASQFLYVGIAGRGLDLSINHDRMRGLRDRLDSHWWGRRSGDQFAVYIFDRFIVPSLTEEQRRQFERGELIGDSLTRHFIQTHLSYRFVVCASYKEAMTIEAQLARGQTSAGFPLLNPRRSKRRVSD